MLMINTLSGGTGLYLKHRHTSVHLCPQPFSLCTLPSGDAHVPRTLHKENATGLGSGLSLESHYTYTD